MSQENTIQSLQKTIVRLGRSPEAFRITPIATEPGWVKVETARRTRTYPIVESPVLLSAELRHGFFD